MTSNAVTMPSGHVRARGLSNTTNLPACIKPKTMDADIFSQLSSAPAHKQDFGTTEAPPKREPSKALLNDDWRNKWRPGGAKPERVPTESAQKIKGPEVDSKMDKKKLRIDTVMAANVGRDGKANYVRYPGASVDPDFILSAPATKKEYDFAEEEKCLDLESGGETGAGNINPTDALQISIGPKRLVHLNAFTPTIEHGFRHMLSARPLDRPLNDANASIFSQRERSFNASSNYSTKLTGMRSVAAKTSSEVLGHDLTSVQFPAAEIREIKNAKRLQLKRMANWNQVDESIRDSFAQLEAPRTAGLPIEQEREKHSNIRQDGRQAVATMGVLEDPSVQSIQLNGQTRMGASTDSAQRETQERKRFDAILAKLNKSSAPARLVDDPAIISMKPASCITIPGKVAGGTERRLSNDSAISGICAPSPQRAISQKSSTLNPTASEFPFSFEQSQKQQPATFGFGGPSKFNRPSVMGFFEEPMPAAPAPSTYDHNQALLERLANLEVQIEQLSELQALQAQKRAIAQQLNIASSFNGSVAQQFNNPSGFNGSYPQVPMLPPNDINMQLLAARGLLPQPGSVPPMAINMPVYPPSGPGPVSFNPGPMAMVPPPGVFPNANTGFPVPPPPDFAIPHIHGLPSMSNPHIPAPHMPQIPVPAMQDFINGPKPMGPASTPVYIPNGALGPKPVRKPKGPARPGDPAWAKAQQEYEAYLEWRRANDPQYHQQCKERQNKRADRLKSSLHESLDNSAAQPATVEIKPPRSTITTARRNSAIEIKAPEDSRV